MIDIILLIILVIIYFIPSLVAVLTKTRLFLAVLVINLFLGWTFIGWVISLAMAFMGCEK